ncbi:SHOCT domain-containing protein [Nocardiopsis mangrovi]|uniref:SHOCT domain-containing protein n=1 Tax=Nocardiopsis mangrovi TaxID=1179818 RepID=A0ABV9DN40_9ACTN
MDTALIDAAGTVTAAAAHGPPWGAGPPPFAHPLIGVAMFLVPLVLIALGFFIATRFAKRRPPWATPPEAPEDGAKRVLAERFARGDIGVDEFMERASVLNWTPGKSPGART